MTNAYEELDKLPANFVPLSPLSFIERSAKVYPNRVAVIHGERRYSWVETYARSRQLADALTKRGIGKGDTVAIMGANTPETYEAHYGVPMTGAVLNALNIRLDAATIAFILDHGEAKVLLTDREFSPTVKAALEQCEATPIVIDIDDVLANGGELIGEMDYEAFIADGDAEFEWSLPADEWQAISLNYTSGTTGNPKGVVYHHRGAYMNAIGNLLAWDMNKHPVYLWTLPMFHCNGWTYTWGVTALAGTHVCLRRVEPKKIFELIAEEQVTHLAGAPVVLNMIANAPQEEKRAFSHHVDVTVGGAPPPSAIIAAMENMGFRVTHLYGLTECFGPSLIAEWQDDWPDMSVDARAAKMSRQGVQTLALSDVAVADPETGQRLPADGQSMGEIMLRGNTLMKGYLENPAETEKAFANGWFHTGDLGVMHEDGYVELRDRSKDVIISGGENISSVEVENVLYQHPQVLEAAVVAKADEKWGETPHAFVDLKSGSGEVSAESIIGFCRDHLARFKVPRAVVFGPLPKTATGKIQKFVLRERANSS